MAQIAVDPNGLAREKVTQINGKKFHTPTMMLTYSFRDNNPRPWLAIPNCSVMTNAFDILRNKRLAKRIATNGIHSELGLTNEICAMDSGGFQFISKGEEEAINPEEVIDLQIASGVDIAVGLDYPLLPNFSEEKAAILAKKSIANIQMAVKRIKNGTEVMPVLHGNSVAEISNYFTKVKKLGEFKIWGIGGLVPQMKQSFPSHKRYFKIIDKVIRARELLDSLEGNPLLHIFGVGSPLAGLLFLLAGADSIESISWIMNAKYFLVYQDKIGARKVSKQTTMCTTSVQWDSYSCSCPVCKGLPIDQVEEKMKLRGNEGFKNRALHNAFIYQHIAAEATKAIKENTLLSLCREKLENHRFFKGILHYTIDKLQKCR